MYDIDGLEKKWRKYKAKQRGRWIVAAFVALAIVSYMIFRVDMSSVLQKNEDTNLSEVENNSTLAEGEKPAGQSRSDNDGEKSRQLAREEIFQPEVVHVEKHKRKYIKIILSDMNQKDDSKEENLSSAGLDSTLESVKERFDKTGEYNDSLYMAREYYKRGNYSEAENWALITNDLNNSIEESWMIFAKSKAKTGESDIATRILDTFIKKSDSSSAKELLREIKEGNF